MRSGPGARPGAGGDPMVEEREEPDRIPHGDAHPLPERGRDHQRQLLAARGGQVDAPEVELQRLALPRGERRALRKTFQLGGRRRRRDRQRRGHAASLLDDDQRAGDAIADAAKPRVARHREQADDIEERKDVGAAEQVAQHAVDESDRVAALLDHTQRQRALAQRASARGGLEEDVVPPLEDEADDRQHAQHRLRRAHRDHQDHAEHQQHEGADQQIDRVGEHAPHRSGHAVPEVNVLGGFDLDGVVQCHPLLPAEAIV